MPISFILHKPPRMRASRRQRVFVPDARADSRGFTLLEMLVVLLIVSLTAGIVVPRMTTMGASFDFALKREAFEQTLNGLAYQAFRDNQDLLLLGDYTAAGRIEGSEPKHELGDTLAGNLRTRSLIDQQREHLPPIAPAYAALPLPPGWRVSVAAPVYFRASGFCGGGAVVLDIGRAEYSYTLSPPQCHAQLVE
ncbi:MAG: prepilin-type N-terminal cleavage/methylation domain-containing protein [Rhodospirillaceae bacterium]